MQTVAWMELGCLPAILGDYRRCWCHIAGNLVVGRII
jgi:hypothetical protein